MNEIRFRTKSLGVDLYWVQQNISGVDFNLGSELGMKEFRFRTKSLGVDFL